MNQEFVIEHEYCGGTYRCGDRLLSLGLGAKVSSSVCSLDRFTPLSVIGRVTAISLGPLRVESSI